MRMRLYWCKILEFHYLKTSFCQFPSSLFPNACVGSCYDNSLPFNGGLTGTSTSRQMGPVTNSGRFVFLIGSPVSFVSNAKNFMMTAFDLLSSEMFMDI